MSRSRRRIAYLDVWGGRLTRVDGELCIGPPR
jgi:hypothetical protein